MVFSASTLFAKTQKCAIDGEFYALQFSLPNKKELFTKLRQKQIAKNDLRENAVLKNGTHVEINQNGCTHHYTVVKFSKLKTNNQVDIFVEADELLSSLPAEKGSQILIISDELKKADKKTKSLGEFPCGAGTCALKKQKDSLQISYDFPI